jgi:excisionase family DNA binding protein
VNDKLLLTVPEVSQALHLSKSVVYALLAAGEIESVRIGRARRVPVGALEAFVARLRCEEQERA